MTPEYFLKRKNVIDFTQKSTETKNSVLFEFENYKFLYFSPTSNEFATLLPKRR